MTEAEWLECDQPQAMLDSLPDEASVRKLRLFAVACCRRVWRLLSDSRSQKAIEQAEVFADGGLSDDELRAASSAAWEAHLQQHDAAYHASQAAVWTTSQSSAFAAREAADAAIAATVCDPDDPEEDNAYQSMTLHCIFGNPFRPVTVDPSWLTATVVSLATAIYDERAFDRLPILADALEDAGCINEEILNHCRRPGEHVRGCWAVDRLLDRK